MFDLSVYVVNVESLSISIELVLNQHTLFYSIVSLNYVGGGVSRRVSRQLIRCKASRIQVYL